MEEPDIGLSNMAEKMTLEVNIPTIFAEKVRQLEAANIELVKRNNKLIQRNNALEKIFTSIQPLRVALLDAAQHLDPWLLDDE